MMYELPITVTVSGIEHPIRNNADYRLILDIIAACQDDDLSRQEQTVTALILFYEELNDIQDIFDLFEDANVAADEMLFFIGLNDKKIGYTLPHKIIDWEADELLIVSAINNVAGTEIRALDYLHWWTFIGYYMAVGESSLSTVVGIRDKIARGKKLENYEKEFKQRNPEYFMIKQPKTIEQKDLEEELDRLWHKKGGEADV